MENFGGFGKINKPDTKGEKPHIDADKKLTDSEMNEQLDENLKNNQEKNTNTVDKLKAKEELVIKVVEEAEKLEIKENDRNEKGELLVSPDGQISNLGKQSELWWKITRTKSFKDFFGDWQNDSKNSSTMIDQNGEPLVLFRGVPESITFSDFYNKDFYEREGASGKGIHFSPDPGWANNYATMKGGVGTIFPAFISYDKSIDTRIFSKELKDFENFLSHFISKKTIKDFPRIPLPKRNFLQVVVDVNKVLIIPNPIDKIKKHLPL